MTDEITGATNQLALFGKTFSQMRTDWDKGFRISALTKILPKVEVSTLKNLSVALKENTVTATQFNDILSHTSTQAQIMGSHIIKLKNQLDAGKITTEEYDSAVQKMISSQSSASITSQLLSAAMRTIVNVGVGIAISGLITLFQKLVNAEKESIQATQDAAKESNSYIKSLDSLKSEYNDIINSTKTASEKTQDLKKWKSELVQLYKDEKDAIEDVNLERETGISLLETEIRRTRDLWLGDNKGNIEKAVRAIENSQYSDLHFVINNDEIFSEGIRKEILELFDNYSQDTDEFKEFLTGLFNGYSQQTAEFKFDTDNIYDTKKRLEDVIALFGSFTDELSPNERELLAQLNNYKDKIDEVIQTHGTTYQTYKEYLAQNSADDLFDEYIKQQGKNIASVTEETFNAWKEGLIALAGESEPIRKALQEIIDNTFPQYVEKEEEIANKSNNVSSAVTSLSEHIEELKKSYDDAFSNQSTIQSAFDKIQKGTSLTSDEMLKLIEVCDDVFPEIGSLFKKTADGYTISADDLIRANDAIIKSAKDVIEADKETIENRQKAIEAQLNNPLANDSRFADTFKALRKEYAENENQLKVLDLILSAFGLTLNTTTEKVNAFDKVIEDSTKSISLIKTAMQEMSEDGHISASTYQALVEKGEDYVACLELVDGKLTLNITKLKELEEQELRNIISKNNLRISELEAQKAHGGTAEVIDKETQALARQNAVLEQQIQDVWSTTGDKGGSTSDEIKDAYTEKQKELKHLLEMEKITQKQYYEMLFGSDEYKALLANRTKYLDELNSLDEEYYKYQQNLYKDNADKQFDDLEDQRKRGIITAEQYAQGLHDLGQELYGEGSIYGGTEFVIKALEELDKKVKETSEDIYDESLDSLKKNNDGTLKSEEKFIEDWIALNDDTWKGVNPKEWTENYSEIADYTQDFYKDLLDKGLLNPDQYKSKIQSFFYRLKSMGIDLGKNWLADALNTVSVDDAMDAWDLENNYDDTNSKNNFELRQDRIDELRKQIIKAYGVDGVKNVKAYTDAMKEADEQQKQLNEDIYAKTKEELSADGDKTLSNILSDADVLWNDTLSLFADGETIKENAKDIFSSVSDALQDALEKGIISADEYETLLRSWGDKLQLTEADITDALVDTYEHRADTLQKANDGSLASERKYIADMKSLNFSTYGDKNSDFYDPTTYASNLRDITDHELDVLGEALKKGEISTREYAEEVAKILDNADVLGADYIAEKQEEIDKIRAEREKQYWEQQKELVEDYYDKQIEELEKIQDEQEKITKAEELRLNLIKARKTLEEAKNNRNQLVFHDGMFEYMSDQDAVMSAEEEVAEAVKAIKDNELQEQIDLLKSQKDEAVSFYDDMISMIEAYINETVNISESDSETLKKIADSQYSKEWKDVRYGDKTANEVTEEQKRAVEKSDDKSDSKPNSNDNVTVKADSVEVKTDTNSSTDIQSDDVVKIDETASTDTISNIATTIKEVGDPLLAFINSFGNGSAFENLVRALGGNPTADAVQNFKDGYNATLVGKQITPSTLPSNVTNNNSTTTNKNQSVNLNGDINVNVSLSVESLDDFVNNKIGTFADDVAAKIRAKIQTLSYS